MAAREDGVDREDPIQRWHAEKPRKIQRYGVTTTKKVRTVCETARPIDLEKRKRSGITHGASPSAEARAPGWRDPALWRNIHF